MSKQSTLYLSSLSPLCVKKTNQNLALSKFCSFFILSLSLSLSLFLSLSLLCLILVDPWWSQLKACYYLHMLNWPQLPFGLQMDFHLFILLYSNLTMYHATQNNNELKIKQIDTLFAS